MRRSPLRRRRPRGDDPIGDLTWTLEGADAGDFTVDAMTGVVSMVARDYEAPQDAGADNVYEVTLLATDADGNDDDESFTVTVTDVEEAAVFTIDSIADRSVAENAPFTAATPSTSGDAPIGDLTWTLEGADAGDFTVDAMTGVVSMVARDYEAPQDANADNVYEVTLLATDADGNDDDESFTVTVTDVEEAAVFTIDSIAGRSVAENAPFTAAAPSTSGDDPIGDLTWTLEGADAGDFTVDAMTGGGVDGCARLRGPAGRWRGQRVRGDVAGDGRGRQRRRRVVHGDGDERQGDGDAGHHRPDRPERGGRTRHSPGHRR